ncbi:MAG: LysR family transcriptional regulator [Endozoicomonas sp.]
MQVSEFDLNLFRVFLAVYHYQSITAAAEVLELTQPGVSGALKRLQSQLGEQLFVRDGRGIAPTHLAHEIARQIEPAMETISNTLSDVQDFGLHGKRRFVVYTTEPVTLMLLPRIEADSTLGNREIVLYPTLTSEGELFDKLNLRQADLAIDFAHFSGSSYFSQPFFADQICLVVSQSHPRIRGKITPEEFYQEKHITLKLRRENSLLVDYFTEERLQPRKVAAECDSLLAIMALVANSESIGMVSINIANLFSQQFGLQVLKAPFFSLPINYKLLAHNREKNSKANRWLRDKLLSYISELQVQ